MTRSPYPVNCWNHQDVDGSSKCSISLKVICFFFHHVLTPFFMTPFCHFDCSSMFLFLWDTRGYILLNSTWSAAGSVTRRLTQPSTGLAWWPWFRFFMNNENEVDAVLEFLENTRPSPITMRRAWNSHAWHTRGIHAWQACGVPKKVSMGV